MRSFLITIVSVNLAIFGAGGCEAGGEELEGSGGASGARENGGARQDSGGGTAGQGGDSGDGEDGGGGIAGQGRDGGAREDGGAGTAGQSGEGGAREDGGAGTAGQGGDGGDGGDGGAGTAGQGGDGGDGGAGTAGQSGNGGDSGTAGMDGGTDPDASEPDADAGQPGYYKIRGTVSQTSGPNGGTEVRVMLFDSQDQVLEPLQQQILTASDGVPLPETAYEFTVPDGATYTVRAFRDSSDMSTDAPDGHPTLCLDAQAPGLPVAVAGSDRTGQDLQLDDTCSAASYEQFNALALNETADRFAPIYDAGSDGWVEGEGLCGGYYMYVQVLHVTGDLSDLTAPVVRLPDGSELELLDDGGCGQTVHDNTSLSYDWYSGDGAFSRGIPDPDNTYRGDYVLHYRNTNQDLIHSAVDRVDPVVLKLHRGTYLNDGYGTNGNNSLKPTMTWDAVSGAAYYGVMVQKADLSENDTDTRVVTDCSYTVGNGGSFELDDHAAVLVWVDAYDADPRSEDVDACSRGVFNYFVTDLDGSNTVAFCGNLSNSSGATGDYLVLARGESRDDPPEFDASERLAGSSTDYCLTVLNDGDCNIDGEGTVWGVIDADGSGDPISSANASYGQELLGLDGCSAVNDAHLTFVPPI